MAFELSHRRVRLVVEGSGTPGDPYRGTVDLFGDVVATPLSSGPNCAGGSFDIAPFDGAVGGTAGAVELNATGAFLASQLVHEFIGARESASRISGTMTVDLVIGGVDAVAFSGPLVLEAQ